MIMLVCAAFIYCQPCDDLSAAFSAASPTLTPAAMKSTLCLALLLGALVAVAHAQLSEQEDTKADEPYESAEITSSSYYPTSGKYYPTKKYHVKKGE